MNQSQIPEGTPASGDKLTVAPRNSVIVYTMACILSRMRDTLGLEAMVEYIDGYRRAIEKHNPLMRSAVEKVLRSVNIQKLYTDVQ